ncbi:MAG: hypothetical protein J6S26_03620 [Solobacterium sp.]|nr:hypothetical protein [Solobacterium sp.]
MLDALLLDLGAVSRQLLPILGALALIFLCVVLSRLAKMIGELTLIVKGLDPAVKSVNDSLVKVQAPLDTAVKYSHTLDAVHDKTMDSVQKIAVSASESVDKVRAYVTEKLSENDPYDEVRPYEGPEEAKED